MTRWRWWRRTPARDAEPASAPRWHALGAEAALERLEAAPHGLGSAAALERLREHGPNSLPEPRRESALELLGRQIATPLVWVLILSGGVAFAVDPVDGTKHGLVIFAVVVLNAAIGFAQEWRAHRAIASLSRMVPERVQVLRDARLETRHASDLVPGDVVQLAGGDRVPADLRLLAGRNLRCAEAALTGESVPVDKSVEPVAADADLGDRCCMLFAGTLVTSGAATAVVVATGDRTELGRISALLRETTDLETPLTRALGEIGRVLTAAIVLVAVAMLAVGAWRTVLETGADVGAALRDSAIFAIALAVGAIPEGLPAIVTIALAIGVRRMASRHAVVRRLPAVETLGSTTVICSDKTGTLTRNEMVVQALWTPASGAFDVTGVGYEPRGAIERGGAALDAIPRDVQELLQIGALCNEAALAEAGGVWSIAGDPTEGALVVAAEKLGTPVAALRARFPRRDGIPFESENQLMATLHAPGPLAGDACILVKGAPEVVLACCDGAAGGALDAAAALREVERMAAHGMRVLAVAARPVAGDLAHLTLADVRSGLTLLGLEAMIDPPRPEAIQAVRRCQDAGITVKMITGDHPVTAAAIGAQLGLATEGGVVAGHELERMSDRELDAIVGSRHVFARVAPEHKLRLVRALQARGEVVAMTGDGVNDAPALEQANIGIAMGRAGTSVAREASDIVLADDDFASIAAAVEEGRRVYDNLVKSLAFVLPTNLGLAMVLMVAVALAPFGDLATVVDGRVQVVHELLLPMLPTQLLWINLVATVALALPLAFEAKEPDVMRRPPRHPGERILSRFVIVRTLLAAALMCAGAVGLFLWEYTRAELAGSDPAAVLHHAAPLARAQTMAVTTVIAFQIFYVIGCRSLRGTMRSIGFFSNPTIFLGIGVLLLLHAAFVYAPPMNAIFGSAPLAAGDLLLAALVGAAIVPVIGIERWDRNGTRRPEFRRS